MQRERVTDTIHVFRSDLYVQVTAGLVMTEAGAVLIDTLLYPEETAAIKRFVEQRLGSHVKYLINTHHHADHTLGTCFFPDAHVISHRLCRELLDTRGRDAIRSMQESSNDLADTQVVLPATVFDDQMTLTVGDQTFELTWSPGHSEDSITCLVADSQVLFAADTVMPLPTFVDGNIDQLVGSIQRLQHQPYETIIQGHGEVILRGELPGRLEEDLNYLSALKTQVERAISNGKKSPHEIADVIPVEACGKEKIVLHGAAIQLHESNVYALAASMLSNAPVNT
ncbi:MAG: MBL fold metallo-hydrolase [Anaerolineaceae bacterium]|nr:MBL fold metallo-hydrolase [Anaerolineaceae bacterium]